MNKLIPLLSFAFVPLHSVQAAERPSVELRWDNDSFLVPFGGDYTDRHYTQGLTLGFWNGDDSSLGTSHGFLWSSKLMNSLWSVGMDIEATRGGLSLGQQMYTPEDIALGSPRWGAEYSWDALNLQSDDRPYAGYLFIAPQWERRGTTSFLGFEQVPTRDRVKIELGIVGPSSGAEQLQTRWHKLLNGPKPVGWHHQLNDEFAFTLQGERSWLFSHHSEQNGITLDLMPTLGFDLGNVSTRLTSGLEFRLGLGQIAPFSLPSLETHTSDYGLYVFGSVAGWAVGRNIFLDGNTFSDSHSVEKEIWVSETRFGFGLRTPFAEGSLGWVHRSVEFEGQDQANSYLAIEARVLF